jgi:ESS family glutamate:Na+ symporter
MLAVPFILSINLPAYSITRENPLYFWAALAISTAYLLFVAISFLIISKRRAVNQPRALWYRQENEGYERKRQAG